MEKYEDMLDTLLDDYTVEDLPTPPLSNTGTGGKPLPLLKRFQGDSISDTPTPLPILKPQVETKTEGKRRPLLQHTGTVDEQYDDLFAELDNPTPQSVDKKQYVPLSTIEAENAAVTANGKTLHEVLTVRRRSPNSIRNLSDEVRDKSWQVKGRVYPDARYVKHKEVQEDRKARDKERKKLSNKFIQKHAKYTEQEKIIMRNLGINNEQFVALMRKKKHDKKSVEKILAAGRYGQEIHFKGRRYRTTVGDVSILGFLSKFKYANTRVLRWINDEPQQNAMMKLYRLKENGLVKSRSVVGVQDLWGCTDAGMEIAGCGGKSPFAKAPKGMGIAPTLGINYIAACLWRNTVNVLNLDDFPANNRQILGQQGVEYVRGEELVSEYEIRSSLGRELLPQTTTTKQRGDKSVYDIISGKSISAFRKWEQQGKQGLSPEFTVGNEYMWVLFPRSTLTLTHHVPDLVVKRERGVDGSPRSIAVELERNPKSNARYKQIMLAYKLDKMLYEKVIWITQNTHIEKQLVQAAEEVGFYNYDIVPVISKYGIVKNPDMWRI